MAYLDEDVFCEEPVVRDFLLGSHFVDVALKVFPCGQSSTDKDENREGLSPVDELPRAVDLGSAPVAEELNLPRIQSVA